MKIITKETGYHIIPSNHEISMVRKTKNDTLNLPYYHNLFQNARKCYL